LFYLSFSDIIIFSRAQKYWQENHLLDPLQPLGASLWSENQPWDGTAALFVATDIKGNI
jgi:hypothetical protein